MAYRTYTDPAQQYQGSGFDPYTGRLQGGQLVMQFMNRMREEQERKKAEQTEGEDRQWQAMLRELTKQEKELGIESAGWEKKYRQTPEQKETERRAGKTFDVDQNIRQIKAGGDVQKDVAQAKPVKTIGDLNKEYLADVESITKTYAGQKATARLERLKAMRALYENKFQYDNAGFESAMKDIEDEFGNYMAYLDEQQEIESASLDDRYSDLPRAQRRAASRKTGAEKPAADAGGAGMKVAGKKTRAELPAGTVVKVAPDGRKLAKIGNDIYEVVD